MDSEEEARRRAARASAVEVASNFARRSQRPTCENFQSSRSHALLSLFLERASSGEVRRQTARLGASAEPTFVAALRAGKDASRALRCLRRHRAASALRSFTCLTWPARRGLQKRQNARKAVLGQERAVLGGGF